jgi:hypothetical protein
MKFTIVKDAFVCVLISVVVNGNTVVVVLFACYCDVLVESIIMRHKFPIQKEGQSASGNFEARTCISNDILCASSKPGHGFPMTYYVPVPN